MTVAKIDLSQKAARSLSVVDRAFNNSYTLVGLIIGTAVIFAGVLYFNFLAANPEMSYGLFKNGIGNVSAMFPLNITPAGWAFSIWAVIYLLQFSWIVYCLGLLCRSSGDGPAYLNPMVLSAPFFVSFNFTSILNVSWLFMWDQFLFLASFVFLLCQVISLYLTVASCAGRIVMYRENLIDQGRRTEVKFLVLAVLNGVSMYAAWVTIATILNLGTFLVYRFSEPLPNEFVSIICLGILTFVTIVYVALDFSYLERYTRYSLSPYFVVVWALAAIISKNWDIENSSSMFSAVLLGAVSLATVIKICCAIYRSRAQIYQYRQMKMGRPAK